MSYVWIIVCVDVIYGFEFLLYFPVLSLSCSALPAFVLFPSTVMSCPALIASTCSLLTCPSFCIKVNVFPAVLVCLLFCGFWTSPWFVDYGFCFCPWWISLPDTCFWPSTVSTSSKPLCFFINITALNFTFLCCLHLGTLCQNQEENQDGIFPYFCQSIVPALVCCAKMTNDSYMDKIWGQWKHYVFLKLNIISQFSHELKSPPPVLNGAQLWVTDLPKSPQDDMYY